MYPVNKRDKWHMYACICHLYLYIFHKKYKKIILYNVMHRVFIFLMVVGIVCMFLPMEMAVMFWVLSLSAFGIFIKMGTEFGDDSGI